LWVQRERRTEIDKSLISWFMILHPALRDSGPLLDTFLLSPSSTDSYNTTLQPTTHANRTHLTMWVDGSSAFPLIRAAKQSTSPRNRGVCHNLTRDHHRWNSSHRGVRAR